MKAILKFNLPEEKYDFKAATDGYKWISACWDFDQWLRSELKYNDSKYSEKEYELLEKIREHFHETIREQGLTFDE